MKKILLTLLSLTLCCLMISCDFSYLSYFSDSKSNQAASKAKPLTLENVDDYIEINGDVTENTTTRCKYDGELINLVNSLKCTVTAKGNPNYEYQDVVLKIRIYHLHPLSKEVVSENTIELDLNLAGNGKASGVLATPVENEEWDNISKITYTYYSPIGIDSALGKTGYEIVGVSGSVEKN